MRPDSSSALSSSSSFRSAAFIALVTLLDGTYAELAVRKNQFQARTHFQSWNYGISQLSFFTWYCRVDINDLATEPMTMCNDLVVPPAFQPAAKLRVVDLPPLGLARVLRQAGKPAAR